MSRCACEDGTHATNGALRSKNRAPNQIKDVGDQTTRNDLWCCRQSIKNVLTIWFSSTVISIYKLLMWAIMKKMELPYSAVSSWTACHYEIFDALRSGIFAVHMPYAFYWQVFVFASCECRRNRTAVASPIKRTNHHDLAITMQSS